MPIKVLYASCRYNPRDRDAGSGVDFNIHETLARHGFETRIAGPYPDRPSGIEKFYRLIHRLATRKLHAKFSVNYLRNCARKIEAEVIQYQPDVIFTHNLVPLVFLKSSVPVIYKTDAVLYNMHAQWPTYSWLELQRMLAWEKAALRRASRVITASRWAEGALIEHYHIPEERILVLPIPSSLPTEEVPAKVTPRSFSDGEVRLLAVAKDYHLKGVDIAEQTVTLLRNEGIPAVLRVAGQSGETSDHVNFMGLFKKEDPAQRAEYLAQFAWADFLIHPARYEAAGIVCGEAAAFGVPSITNAIGGLATTVENGVSGVVLPQLSPAEEYARVIRHYVEHSQEYTDLRRTTRERYESVLNWDSAGDRIAELIRSAVHEHRKKNRKADS
jgi:glycosyltransferase involved in cell wall biosynthesis